MGALALRISRDRMAETQKSSQARVAFALLCGLAICCSVMYITADGDEAVKYSNIETVDVDTTDEEDHLSDVAATEGLRVGVNKAGATGTGKEIKVESWDVKKVGKIITDDTPHEGRYLLLDYLNKVEKEIATETAARKDDIEKLRIQMAKNRAYNAKARSAMKKELLARMAVNAKKAKDDLDEQMRITAKNFAAAKALENKRWRKNNKRFKKTRAIMKRNKRQAAHELKMATLNQQRALSALDAPPTPRSRQPSTTSLRTLLTSRPTLSRLARTLITLATTSTRRCTLSPPRLLTLAPSSRRRLRTWTRRSVLW